MLLLLLWIKISIIIFKGIKVYFNKISISKSVSTKGRDLYWLQYRHCYSISGPWPLCNLINLRMRKIKDFILPSYIPFLIFFVQNQVCDLYHFFLPEEFFFNISCRTGLMSQFLFILVFFSFTWRIISLDI